MNQSEGESMGLVALYVPGSRADRFDKAVATGAAVILDLEDSVAGPDKPAARMAVAAWLTGSAAGHGRGAEQAWAGVQVRVNAPGTAELVADLEALPAGVPLRVAKVGSAADLVDQPGLAGHPVHALIETALGVEHAQEIASAPGVVSIGLGEADLAAELRVEGEEALGWVRQRVVVAAAAADLSAPLMSAYPDLVDLAGLEASCRRGRALGFRGRAAVHPRQVAVIRTVFAVSSQEADWAREVLRALDGTGVATLADGSMVDAAMARRARALLRS